MNICKSIQETVLNGELNNRQKEHLRTCEECRIFSKIVDEAEEVLPQQEDCPVTWESVKQKLQQKNSKYSRKSRPSQRRFLFMKSFAIAAMVLIALIPGVMYYFSLNPERNSWVALLTLDEEIQSCDGMISDNEMVYMDFYDQLVDYEIDGLWTEEQFFNQKEV